MNAAAIRAVSVREEGGELRLPAAFGYATDPLFAEYALDPATALVLAGKLEHCVHGLLGDANQISGAEPQPDQPINPS